MIFRQFLNESISAASYLIGCAQKGVAAVVDPSLPPDVYLMAAADKGLRITTVIETHFHADYISTGRALAAQTGAVIYAPSRDDIENDITGASVHYPHIRVRDGDEIRIGNVVIRALHTPGHTPEHMAYLVIDTPRSNEPWMVLTGDSLFVNDVARTDLVDLPLCGPRVIFESMQKLMTLPDYCEVYPAHYGGSACGGKQMSGKPVSTIGFERRFNWVLQSKTPEEFENLMQSIVREVVESVLIHRNTNRGVLPLPPDYYQQSAMRHAPAATLQALTLDQVQTLQHQGAVLLDVRTQLAFAQAHPAGALNITFNQSNRVKRAKMLIEPAQKIVVLGDVPTVAQHAAELLAEAGMNVIGYLNESVEAWMAAGLPTEQVAVNNLEGLYQHVLKADAVILDVRDPFEWEKQTIPNGSVDVRLIALGELRDRWHELPRDRHIVIVCESGTRASAAASWLRQKGFTDLEIIAPEGVSDYAKRYPTTRLEKALV
ncbi:MAG: rhodanese-like domain-containing protein [Thermoflexales bacterium]|nr:rhodanese-like domain-containing protein [Thermoflexales bacterium]